MRRPGLALIVIVVGVAGCSAALGWVAATVVRSPQDLAADNRGPDPTLLTVPVRAGRLVDALVTTAVVRSPGEVRIEPAAPASGRLAVITDKPVEVGRTVAAGDVVAEVSDRPTIVLPGRIPLIRDLRRGDQGADVTRFQVALASAGFPSYDVAGTFGPSTEQAVEQLYAGAGYAPLYESTPNVAGVRPAPARDRLLVSRSEIALVPSLPAVVTEAFGPIGARVASAPLVVLATAKPFGRVVATTVDAQQIRRGAKARLSWGDLSGRVRVVKVGRPQTSSEGGVLVPLDISLGRFAREIPLGARPRVTVRWQVADRPGLLVPVSAVQLDAGGRTVVRKVTGEGVRTVVVRVRASSAGQALIATGDLEAGDPVVVGGGEGDG